MNVQRTADNSGDHHPTVSTLHIPATNTFIPFQQFSLSDGTTIRNPADDNNNKTLPVVSVMAAVTGLCPAVSMVSMQQPSQLAQAVVAPTIIPAVVTPIAVQAANCFTPTTTMTVSNTVNISSRLSIPTPHQQTLGNGGISISHQTGGLLSNNLINHIITTSCQQTPLRLPGVISTAPSSAANGIKATNSPVITSTNIIPAKSSLSNIIPAKSSLSNTSSSAKSANTSPKTSSASSNQSSNSEQSDDLVKPVFKDGELVLEVECGQNKAILYLSKLCQGSKGPCINFQNSWLTPNEFQFVSGRETAKDWKRSIRHHGKSLKLLLAKGILNVHPTMCDCDGCRQGATLTRKGEKRRIPNGERKIKKPSSNSNSSGNCAEGSGIRPGTAPLVVAHVGAPGIAQGKPELTHVKPELQRPLGDMLKMADATIARGPLEAGITSQRQNLSNKPPAVQRPDSLTPAKDFPKHKVVSLNTVSTTQFTQTQVATTPTVNPSSVTPLLPVCSPAAVASSAAFSPSTSNAVTSHQAVTPLCTSNDVTTHEAAQTITVATPLSPERTSSSATVEGIVAGPALSVPEVHSNLLPLDPALPQIINPGLSNSNEVHNPTPTTCDYSHLAEESSDVCKMDKSDSGLSDDEDINVGNDTDDSFNTDSKSDTPDDDSDDECPEYSNQMSEDNDSICDTQTAVEASPKTVVDKAELPIKQKAFRDSFYLGLADQKPHMNTQDDAHGRQSNLEGQEHSYELKKHLDTQEHEPFPKTSTPIPNMCGIYDSFRQTEAVSLQTACSASTTLAIAAVSGACSKPLSLSISTSNVKSEHVWIPPTVSSSASENHSIRHTQQGSSRNNKSPSMQSQQVKRHHEEGHKANKDTIKHTPCQKSDTSLDCGEYVSPVGTPENCATHVVLPYRNPHADDGQQPQHDKGPEHDVVSKEISNQTQAQISPSRSDPGHDKNIKDRDREEKHKLRLKEDKIRKDREERIKKDRDRDERRDRERRDEKEAERQREEERERKVQFESKCGKDMPAVSPSSDPFCRPTGGVAEAAAFSDYMRFLAAGHGHSFMSPTSGYMCSFFPFQPQESALPPHLVHQLNSFSPQMGNIHKDPLLYPTSSGTLANYGAPSFGHMPHVLHRPQYSAQQSLLEYQRSLASASSYPWAAAYPYFIQSSPSAATAAAAAASAASVAAGTKRSSTELEATMELGAKRMRYDGRFSEYTSPWDYFAAATSAEYQQLRVPAMAPSLPCGLESASMDKTAEYLRKRYMEYGPQAAMYLSALPEYARPAYQCACADHRDEDIRLWSVEDVCRFLSTLDGCGMYVEYFREQRVNGRILSMLTSDHLVSTMGMKLGSAVLLSEAVAKKMQETSKMSNCEACRSIALSVPMHPMVLPL